MSAGSDTKFATLRRWGMLGALAFLATGCTALTDNRVSVDYYSISGKTTAALDRQIRSKGPRIAGGRHAVAVARIRMVPDVAYAATGGACRVSRARVLVDAKVTLPRFTGRHRAPRSVNAAWDSIDRYTRLHEAVHVAIAFRYAKRMESAVRALPTQPSCQSLQRTVKRRLQQYLDEHDAAQRKFDADEQARFEKLADSRMLKRRG